MVVIASCARRFHAAVQKSFHGKGGDGLACCDYQYAASRQIADKAFAGSSGDQDLHVVERMGGAMIVSVDGHVGIKIKSLHFTRRFLSVGKLISR